MSDTASFGDQSGTHIEEREVLISQLRQSRARESVERHATYAAVGGFLPLPLLDIASVIAINVNMLRNLSSYYDQPFDHARTAGIISSVMTSLAAAGSGAATSWLLSRVVPGANLVGMAASSTVAALLTRRMGHVFVDHFEAGGTPFDFSEEELREAIEAVLRRSSTRKRQTV